MLEYRSSAEQENIPKIGSIQKNIKIEKRAAK